MWGSSRVGAASVGRSEWKCDRRVSAGITLRIFHHGTWNPRHRQKTCADRMPHGTR